MPELKRLAVEDRIKKIYIDQEGVTYIIGMPHSHPRMRKNERAFIAYHINYNDHSNFDNFFKFLFSRTDYNLIRVFHNTNTRANKKVNQLIAEMIGGAHEAKSDRELAALVEQEILEPNYPSSDSRYASEPPSFY